MAKCPYCGKAMNTSKELPDMTPREFRIYNLLIGAGRDYTSLSDIKETALSRGQSDTSVRVALHYLDKKIAAIGQKITNHNRVGYRIEER